MSALHDDLKEKWSQQAAELGRTVGEAFSELDKKNRALQSRCERMEAALRKIKAEYDGKPFYKNYGAWQIANEALAGRGTE